MRPAMLPLVLMPLLAWTQASIRAPIATRPPIEIRGRILKVATELGQGMPALEVEVGGQSWKVWLGSMRYLVENNFNPKAGQRVTVKGFRPASENNELWAMTVTLEDTRQTIRLRDEAGWPAWRRGGGHSGGPGRRGRGPGKYF